MTTYRERLNAPISWWLAALAFAAVWGWVVLVATTWPVASVTTVIVMIADLLAVWRYGSVVIEVHPDGLRVGDASIHKAYIGTVEVLNRSAYRRRLGTGADARAHLVIRPYVDRGVLVRIDDDRDPTPYWLVSSRHPEAFAAVFGHTEDAPPPAVRTTIGEAARGEEA